MFYVLHNSGGAILDIMLERILSLIPRKENGKYAHGAKKQFAESIGYNGGEIVSMWEKGDSKSYQGKIHEIASVYDVSVEWLKGETDEKKPLAVSDEGRLNQELIGRLVQLTPEELEKVDAFVQGLLAAR